MKSTQDKIRLRYYLLKDLGDTECGLAANAVVLVLGECQISIATYLRGGGGAYNLI